MITISGVKFQVAIPHKLQAIAATGRLMSADAGARSIVAVAVLGKQIRHPKVPAYQKGDWENYALEVFDALTALGCKEDDIINAASDFFFKEVMPPAKESAHIEEQDLEDAENLSGETEGSTTD